MLTSFFLFLLHKDHFLTHDKILLRIPSFFPRNFVHTDTQSGIPNNICETIISPTLLADIIESTALGISKVAFFTSCVLPSLVGRQVGPREKNKFFPFFLVFNHFICFIFPAFLHPCYIPSKSEQSLVKVYLFFRLSCERIGGKLVLYSGFLQVLRMEAKRKTHSLAAVCLSSRVKGKQNRRLQKYCFISTKDHPSTRYAKSSKSKAHNRWKQEESKKRVIFFLGSSRRNFGNKMAAPMVLHPPCLLSNTFRPLFGARRKALKNTGRLMPSLINQWISITIAQQYKAWRHRSDKAYSTYSTWLYGLTLKM